MNCAMECGALAGNPGVQIFNTVTKALGALSGSAPATVAALDGGNLYVAGTPFGNEGLLNGGKITKLNATTLAIGVTKDLAPGYHDTIAVQSGKVFVGSRACTLASPPSSGNQSCLGIFDGTNTTISTSYEGDVTGMQAISGRSVVYVIMGGELRIYDANTSAPQSQQLDIIGHAEQVVQVDP
jgi:hypothetical protein